MITVCTAAVTEILSRIRTAWSRRDWLGKGDLRAMQLRYQLRHSPNVVLRCIVWGPRWCNHLRSPTTRTCDLFVPNEARYRLRHTPLC